jgi:hypothetical protein
VAEAVAVGVGLEGEVSRLPIVEDMLLEAVGTEVDTEDGEEGMPRIRRPCPGMLSDGTFVWRSIYCFFLCFP